MINNEPHKLIAATSKLNEEFLIKKSASSTIGFKRTIRMSSVIGLICRSVGRSVKKINE